MTTEKPVVLHLITSLRGGPGRLLCDMLMQEEIHARYRHAVCSMYGPDPGLDRRLEGRGVPVTDLGMSRFLDLRALRRLKAFIKDLNPQVLHTSLFRADLLGQRQGKILKVPVRVASILNTDDIAIREDYGRILGALFVLIYRHIAKWAGGFVASSDEVARNLAAKRIRPSSLAVFRNALDMDAFLSGASLSRDAYRFAQGFKPEEIVIGSASVFNKRKGLPYLIDAFSQTAKMIPKLRLFLPGDGPLRAELEKLAGAEPAIAPSIVFPGRIENMTDFLNAVDIYVQPALSEGLPMAVLQAMAAGKPILATRVGGIPEAVRDGIDGILVEPRDAAALSSKLADLVRQPDLRQKLGESARLRAFEEFHSRRLALETASLYDRLAENPR